MSTTSSTTEKVDHTALADHTPGHMHESKGDVEQAQEPVDTPEPEARGEYPGGFRLAMVVLALVLAVFLVSLDLVS